MQRRALLSAALLFSIACGPVPEDAGVTDASELASTEQGICITPRKPNLLSNGSFDTAGLVNPVTVTTPAPGSAGWSAADGWTMFTNTPGYIYSRVLPSARPNSGSSNMIQVNTLGWGNGLVQVFKPFGTGPQKATAGAWVFVLRGKIGIGTGNGGNTGLDALSQTTGQWEYLTASNGVSPANEFVIYSADVGGAEFFVDTATVLEMPNLLKNPDFDTLSGNTVSVTTSVSVPGGAGVSAAANWTLFANTAPARFYTEVKSSTRVSGARMMRVITTAERNGLVQVFQSDNPCDTDGPDHSLSGAWVYVRSGKVGLGTGNGGNTHIDVESTTLNQWEWLQAPNGVSPANELILYSTNATGADFDVDFATVNQTP
ncbi:hypothetical protein JY651_40665 [Pyxidicoccus parkwayensis]|uniref:Lipoprotein n=1 Tax=Pyxidicoccus parkwayensis TaxID=2813578 RepID=A0ABX7NRV9_9BACT|nr:hypothetical protein [Pyxidicoccus parkwaysis]QSQ21438.1 hypothetical protein JY651_40665 [Pyxidicoccus parkwaysis]